MKRTYLLGAVLVLGVGCDVVLGVEAGVAEPPEVKVECEQDEGCSHLVAVSDCGRARCENNKCVTDYVEEGSSTPDQVANDCLRKVCDGHGGTKQEALDDADDGNPCTEEHCKDGVIGKSIPLSGTNVACYLGSAETRGRGICKDGTIACSNGLPSGQCAGEIVPKTEVCQNGTDDDCDGNPDANFDGCVCGDGKVTSEVGEGCDDGATADGDDCSPTCEEQRVLQIVGSAGHYCALLSHNELKCWGRDSFGELGYNTQVTIGDGPEEEMGKPLQYLVFGGNRTVKNVSAGNATTCVVLNDGAVKCWGYNAHGQLGKGDIGNNWTLSPESLPDIPLGEPAIAVSASIEHTCALLASKQVKCWGYNVEGALGLADDNYLDHPLPTKAIDFGGVTVEAISAGSGYHTCALLTGGDVKCWGYNSAGQLGHGTTAQYGRYVGQMGKNLPRVPLNKPAIAISVGAFHSCALLVDHSAICWGDNQWGELGIGSTDHQGDAPGEIKNLKPIDLGLTEGAFVSKIHAYGGATCALISDGSLKCWGYNHFNGYFPPGQGQENNIGDAPNEMGVWLQPIDVGQGQHVTDVAISDWSTCALLSAGNVKCWGGNMVGLLGQDEPNQGYKLGYTPNEMGDALPTVKLFSNLW